MVGTARSKMRQSAVLPAFELSGRQQPRLRIHRVRHLTWPIRSLRRRAFLCLRVKSGTTRTHRNFQDIPPRPLVEKRFGSVKCLPIIVLHSLFISVTREFAKPGRSASVFVGNGGRLHVEGGNIARLACYTNKLRHSKGTLVKIKTWTINFMGSVPLSGGYGRMTAVDVLTKMVNPARLL